MISNNRFVHTEGIMVRVVRGLILIFGQAPGTVFS